MKKNPLVTFNSPGNYNVSLTARSDSIGTCSIISNKIIYVIDNNTITDISHNENSLNIVNRNGKLIFENRNLIFDQILLIDMNGRIVTNSTSSNYLDISDVSSEFILYQLDQMKKLTEKIHISSELIKLIFVYHVRLLLYLIVIKLLCQF